MKVLTRLLAAILIVAACSSDGTDEDDEGVPPDQLNVLRLPITAPELCADSVGMWFHKRATGGPEELALTFPDDDEGCGAEGEEEDFLRLRLQRNSLSQLPDGTPVEVGDSVFISVKWVGSDSVLFEMMPAGLRFTSNARARLKIEYDKLGGDLDDDGDLDNDDDDIERQLSIWRQEAPNLPAFKVGSVRLEDDDEIEADLNGFTRFMIAY